jgi:hypothetical protein
MESWRGKGTDGDNYFAFLRINSWIATDKIAAWQFWRFDRGNILRGFDSSK